MAPDMIELVWYDIYCNRERCKTYIYIYIYIEKKKKEFEYPEVLYIEIKKEFEYTGI